MIIVVCSVRLIVPVVLISIVIQLLPAMCVTRNSLAFCHMCDLLSQRKPMRSDVHGFELSYSAITHQ